MVDDRDGTEEIVSTEDEVQPCKQVKRPTAPTQSELDEHRVDHLPYRDWCPECVEGFGRESPHISSSVKSAWIPVISCDYLFVTTRGAFAKDDFTPMDGEDHMEVSVIYDSKIVQYSRMRYHRRALMRRDIVWNVLLMTFSG